MLAQRLEIVWSGKRTEGSSPGPLALGAAGYTLAAARVRGRGMPPLRMVLDIHRPSSRRSAGGGTRGDRPVRLYDVPTEPDDHRGATRFASAL